MLERQDRIDELEEAIYRAIWEIQFMHGCLTQPDHYKYAYPEQTEKFLDELYLLAPPPDLCAHSRPLTPGCSRCETSHQLRVRKYERELRREG